MPGKDNESLQRFVLGGFTPLEVEVLLGFMERKGYEVVHFQGGALEDLLIELPAEEQDK